MNNSREEQLSIAHVEVFIYTARVGEARISKQAQARSLTDLEDVLHAAGLQELEAATEGDVAVVVGRRARQGRVHTDVALVPRERPVHDAPLHRLRDAFIALLDALEGDRGGDDLGRDVEQGRRGARPAAHARRTRRHGARSAARRGLTDVPSATLPPRPLSRLPPPGRPARMCALHRHTTINYSFGRHNVRYIIKSWHFCFVLLRCDYIRFSTSECHLCSISPIIVLKFIFNVSDKFYKEVALELNCDLQNYNDVCIKLPKNIYIQCILLYKIIIIII